MQFHLSTNNYWEKVTQFIVLHIQTIFKKYVNFLLMAYEMTTWDYI